MDTLQMLARCGVVLWMTLVPGGGSAHRGGRPPVPSRVREAARDEGLYRRMTLRAALRARTGRMELPPICSV